MNLSVPVKQLLAASFFTQPAQVYHLPRSVVGPGWASDPGLIGPLGKATTGPGFPWDNPSLSLLLWHHFILESVLLDYMVSSSATGQLTLSWAILCSGGLSSALWDTHQHSVIGLYHQMPVAPPNQDNQTCIQGGQIHPFENKSSKEKESLLSKIPRAIRKIALSYYHHAKSAHLRVKPTEGNARDMKSDLMTLLQPLDSGVPKASPTPRTSLM